MGKIRKKIRKAGSGIAGAVGQATDYVEDRSNAVGEQGLSEVGFEEGGIVQRSSAAAIHGIQGVSLGANVITGTGNALLQGDLVGAFEQSSIAPITGAVQIGQESFDIMFPDPGPGPGRGNAAAETTGAAEEGPGSFEATVGNSRRATPAAIRAKRRAYRSGGGGATGGAGIRV